MEALVHTHADTIQQHLKTTSSLGSHEEQTYWKRLKSALDSVSGQCDAYASRLYWYTNLADAKAAAKAQAKPILSLRLLGNLVDEYSCANSRFFRTTLYPNTEVSKYLREHFILHWQSVRPVPRITIDFGDGRMIERTITGNSVHYILDSEGKPVDALPGLYGPKAFLTGLAAAERAVAACAGLNAPQSNEYLREYHQKARAASLKEWNDDLAKIGAGPGSIARVEKVVLKESPPSAQAAGRLAVSKSAVESPMLKSLQGKLNERSSVQTPEMTDETWARIAALHSDDARLDGMARAVLFAKSSVAMQASQRTASKRLVENPFLRAWLNLQSSIAEDTVRNEFQLHGQIHDWFVQGIAPGDVAALNSMVYAELFLTPDSDPWLGLAPAYTFTALPNDGLVQPVQKRLNGDNY
jgi:hypothetical protein